MNEPEPGQSPKKKKPKGKPAPPSKKPEVNKCPAYNAAIHRPELHKCGLLPQFKEYWKDFRFTRKYTNTAAAEAAWRKIWPLYVNRKPEEVMRNQKRVSPGRIRRLLRGKKASNEENLAWAIEAIGMQTAGVPVDFYSAPSWQAIGLYKMAQRDESKLFRKMEEIAESIELQDDGGQLGMLEEILKQFDEHDQETKRPEAAVPEPAVPAEAASGSAA